MAELKRNKMKKLIWLALLVFSCSLRAFAQNQTDACILNDAKDGQIVTVRGKAMDEPHDLAFGIVGCNDLVMLAYAGDRDTDVSADQLRNDENLKRFQKYTSAVYKSTGKNICIECAQYGDVEAELTGKLEIGGWRTLPRGTDLRLSDVEWGSMSQRWEAL
jgi:hypothetical protein